MGTQGADGLASHEKAGAHADTLPLPYAKLARRLAQLDPHAVHKVTLWHEGGKLKCTIETVGKIETLG